VDAERANQEGEWLVHLARTGVKRNVQKVLVEKSEVKISIVRPTHTSVDVKMDILCIEPTRCNFGSIVY